MPIVDAPDWDEEAIEEAEYRARAIGPFDEDGARDLRAMAAAARAKLTGQPIAPMQDPYDPMKIYARMAKFYRFSHQEMEQMHFVTFFAYVREANEISEDEQKEYDRAKQGQGTPDLGMLPAERYEGETVAI